MNDTTLGMEIGEINHFALGYFVNWEPEGALSGYSKMFRTENQKGAIAVQSQWQ